MILTKTPTACGRRRRREGAVPILEPIKRRFIFKSSITGKDFSAAFARDNPGTTFRQSVIEPPKKKP
jgi:hypothetical protein